MQQFVMQENTRTFWIPRDTGIFETGLIFEIVRSHICLIALTFSVRHELLKCNDLSVNYLHSCNGHNDFVIY